MTDQKTPRSAAITRRALLGSGAGAAIVPSALLQASTRIASTDFVIRTVAGIINRQNRFTTFAQAHKLGIRQNVCVPVAGLRRTMNKVRYVAMRPKCDLKNKMPILHQLGGIQSNACTAE